MDGSNYANDDELTFISLAALTANVTRWLLKPDEQKHETPSGEPDRGDADEKEREAHAKYVAHRLNELRSWERKISGRKD
jgi:hypothetical protein